MTSATHRIALTFFSNALAPLASLATAPLLARGLGVDGRGEVAAALAPLILGATIATAGMPTAATFLVARMPGVARLIARRTAVVLVTTGLVATSLIALISPWLAAGDPDLRFLIVLAGVLTIPTMLVVLLQGVASGLDDWDRVFRERAISAVGRVIGITALFASGHLTPVSAMLVLSLVPLLGGFAYVGLLPRVQEEESPPTYQALLHLGGRIWFGALSGILLARLDQAVMTPLSSIDQLGYYAVAVSMSELALVANNSIREVMFPDLASNFDKERLATAARVSSLVATALGLSVAAGSVVLIPTLFGEAFRPSVSVALILILAVLIGNPGSMAGVGLNAIGRPGRRSAALAIACVVNLALILVLVPPLGAVGAAIATLVGNLVSSNLNIILMSRLGGPAPLEFYLVRASDVAALRGAATRLTGRAR